MESYSQPWTVINKYEQSEPKSYEYYAFSMDSKKPQYQTTELSIGGKWEKPEYCGGKWEKPEYCGGKWEKSEMTGNTGRWEKPEYCGGKWEKPEYCGGKWEKSGEFCGKYEKPEYCGGNKWEMPQQYMGKWEKPQEQYRKLESLYGGLEKVCDSLERVQLERPMKESRWSCAGKSCCDEEMVKLVKDLINILIGAEQSYIQLGFLCMDEKFTLVNTSEYFRLCGLRMRWLANGLINKSVRLFNVNEWINNTTFQNWFKVPTKEELATNDYTTVIKTFFKITMDAETRLVERMTVLGEKIMKTDWVNTECRFEGFKWFVNFVLPYQTNFVREMVGHWRNIEMCNNGFIFDKCEMYPLVQKIEEFIHEITKFNVINGGNDMPVWEKNGLVRINKRW